MANLPDQVRNGVFSDNPALEEALELALHFLSRRFDVYETFDDDNDDLKDVEDHVSGKNLPPLVVNPRTALRVSDDGRCDIVSSVHCDINSEASLREHTHIVSRFANVRSDIGIVVSIDESLVDELKRVSVKEKSDVARRLLICYAAVCYLHELAHTKVAAFLVKDRSLTTQTPEKCRCPSSLSGSAPEAGFTAECLILGCILDTDGFEEFPYQVRKDKCDVIHGISVLFPSSRGRRKITVPFVQHVEAVLSGDSRFKGKAPEMLEKEARAALGRPTLDEVTPSEEADTLVRWSSKWKSSSLPGSDYCELPSYSSPPWRRAPKTLRVFTEGVVIGVSIEDDCDEPFEFSIGASGLLANSSDQVSLRTKTPRQRCSRIGFLPASTISNGEHKFRLDELYEIADTDCEEFVVIVVVGSKKTSVTIKRD